ncbi:cytochrome d ubiquinol oxidase subunit II [Lutibaculum baratangense]|uniref:Putative Cytochrome bd2, subunit II n=1 Tax=Lutibaculum baratangense AMV1 TaxID=631454 RepID=V4T733_9HYPH|nr:cytochrome d ubiquinol oxidase subunit II [Lutibaculum baratangense]ESR22428.1 putative Cytochrome bd2, subunit II [Lutibaculum baratangense AMV1]
MEEWLPFVWAGIIGLAVVFYVIADGFDLGIGILFPFTSDEEDRDVMMNSVAPFWDGNETWLVLGGGGLLVAFPLAYSIIMPALYVPLILMLLALIFRGVSFEFRWVSKPNHKAWDFAFWAGSTVATFCQGLVLGGFLQGISVTDERFSGNALDFLTPFSIMCGFGLVAGYALIGATWLIMRTEGRVMERAVKQSQILLLIVLAFIVIVSVWTPLSSERIAGRWFAMERILWLWPVPLATAALAWFAWAKLRLEWSAWPFVAVIGLFLLAFVGLGISTYPYIVPPDITIVQAASSPSTQMFMLWGVLILLPVILGYIVFVYYTFRGKVRPGEGYH